ncbi:uncharacterized protein LOC114888011 [Monodon monoceros]|uniref:uncharacterized protein LOC114888011 n=1 Tax=Monodon monoceros TaxID=40151 RepID=UPI0010F47BE1|nr:uncharacterized protein LOC114888011 [Monodon monoceros]
MVAFSFVGDPEALEVNPGVLGSGPGFQQPGHAAPAAHPHAVAPHPPVPGPGCFPLCCRDWSADGALRQHPRLTQEQKKKPNPSHRFICISQDQRPGHSGLGGRRRLSAPHPTTRGGWGGRPRCSSRSTIKIVNYCTHPHLASMYFFAGFRPNTSHPIQGFFLGKTPLPFSLERKKNSSMALNYQPLA